MLVVGTLVWKSLFLFLLLYFRFNISTNINRCGKINFGRPHLHLIDRIQIKIQQIYNIFAWKNHTNVLKFKSIENFDSIGIAERNYSVPSVNKGKVNYRVRVRDVVLVAEKMKLKMPPLPFRYYEEIRILNYFMKEKKGSLIVNVLNWQNVSSKKSMERKYFRKY